ncbi:Auxilin-related protein 2 [Hordeum vulgare]|nr:Auxilin-related protein 2 [Hordeum vulgare]
MDDFQGILARDFGLRPKGKAAPMSAARAAPSSGSAWDSTRSAAAPAPSAPSYDDLFGAPSSAPPPKPAQSTSIDSIFDSFAEPSASAAPPKPKHSSMPVFDKPVYDDDIFDGVPGVKSSSLRYDDVFAGNHAPAPADDDLLAGFGTKSEAKEVPEDKWKPGPAASSTGFDDLFAGIGRSSPVKQRQTAGAKEKKVPTSQPASMSSDPFVSFETTSTSARQSSGIFSDPLDELSRHSKSQVKTAVDNDLFEDSSTFNQIPKSEPLFTTNLSDDSKVSNGSTKPRDSSPEQNFPKRNSAQQPSVEDFENIFPQSQSARFSDVHVDSSAPGSEKYSGNGMDDRSPRSDESEDEIWLTVSEIPLFTQPTSAPPPSRQPPSLAIKQKPHGSRAKRRDDDYLRHSTQNYNHNKISVNQAGGSSMDELEDFAMGKPQKSAYDNANPFYEDEFERNSSAAASAAAMKEAMDKAEAKFKHAKEVRERERDAKLRNKEQQEQDDEARSYAQDREERERQDKLDREKEMRQREEKEREQRRLEEEKELEQQRERGRGRQAVERATKEARERAAIEARAKAEREARQRNERAAVQRALQEARERAAVGARDKADRAAAESKDRAAAEAKERAAAQTRERASAERAAVERAQDAKRRADRAAVERAAAEVRERQAAEARERQAASVAAAAAREKQSKPDDLESFFGMGTRANSAPKQRAPTVDPTFNAQSQSRGAATTASASSMRKASSTTNFADDLSAIFGGAPTSSDEFQAVEGESEERRRARLERHQRTRERAAKALAEKNERDMNVQREQAERDRISESLDFEIKRWAAGKEGNLRALLSTMQYVLWPECGWQPVSLTDLITAAAVKKVYRKATLCIHPDKVQQKGANLQQKYIAEKVFDLLKEAWNKFNSEELF